MEQYEYSKYITNKEGLRETINKYGVAIEPILKINEKYDFKIAQKIL